MRAGYLLTEHVILTEINSYYCYILNTNLRKLQAERAKKVQGDPRASSSPAALAFKVTYVVREGSRTRRRSEAQMNGERDIP